MILKKLKDLFVDFYKIFQEHFKNIFSKAITKAIKNQAGVVHIIPFAPTWHAYMVNNHQHYHKTINIMIDNVPNWRIFTN
jgi:hypothetical protein